MDEVNNGQPHAVQAEQDLADALIELSQCLVCGIGRDGRIVRFNQTCELVTGFAATDVIGRDARAVVIPPEDAEAFGAMLADVWAAARPHPTVGEWLTRDGRRRTITWANRPLLDGDGSVRELVCTGLDITERERAAAQVRHLASEQSALRRTATLVASGAELDEVCQCVADETAQVLGVPAAMLVRFDSAELGTIVGRHTADPRADFPLGGRVPLDGDSAVVRVQRTGRAARIDDFDGRPGAISRKLDELGYRSTAAAPIAFTERPWGAIVIGTTDDRRLPEQSEQRLAQFAEIVGLALASTQARDELAASRARIVQAGDEARRRLERNLHDGAQQRLVSLAMMLRLVVRRLDDDPQGARAMLADADRELGQALAELRELARGIHPAVLSEHGLGAALAALAARAPFPVEVAEPGGAVGALPKAVEVAAYYVASEALANAAKHAQAGGATIAVTRADGHAVIEIRDDGCGGADRDGGSGLRGLADRVEALRGRLKIDSPPGAGTAIRAELPLI